MMERLTSWLVQQGLSQDMATVAAKAIAVVVIVIVATIANFVAKRIILGIIKRIVHHSSTQWDDIVLKRGVFERLSQIAPAVVIYFLVPLAFPNAPGIAAFVGRVALAYIMVIGLRVILGLLDGVLDIYRTFEVSRRRSISGYVQIAKLLLFLTFSILVVAMVVGRSPIVFLSGLGAVTAILLLVFKDTILGFVASIQIAANDMVRPDDWIEMPKYGADGSVIDVSLNTVKVRNWDKTVTTIPTYALIADSFKNWRGMSESGGRRIKRAIYLDMTSIRFCDEEMIERFKKIQFIREYINKKTAEISQYNKEREIDESVMVNGRRMTNLGTFRAYVEAYLHNHPMIHEEMTFLVRHLAPTAHGLPIEVYVFSKDQRWPFYEGIQADILDHLLAVIPEFDLRVFQSPSGSDVKALQHVGTE